MNAQVSLLNQKFESVAMLKDKAQEYAKSQGFAVVTCNSNLRSLLLRCRHGGMPRNYRKLTDDDVEGSKKRKVVKSSMRNDCPWILRAKRDLPYWVISELVDTHNHAIGRNPLVYHQHRKLNGDDHQKLQEYMAAKARNIVIYEALRDVNKAPKLLLKDIQNYRTKLSADGQNERVAKLIMSLESRGYITRYEGNDDRQLKYLFFSHQDAIVQARRFHEVVLIDTTYKTNRQGLLYVNIVGISNVGNRKSLSTFTIAGGLLVKEDEYAMSWILAVLKETVFSNGELPIFVTDAAMQLRNSIATIFHSSKHLLCTWHIANNFETRLMKTFPKEEDWIALKAALKAIINSKTAKDFQSAKRTYLVVSKLSQDQEDVEGYLERRLKDAEMWVGMHTSKLLHFGATTTQRVEGSHASIKHVLEGRMNLDEVMDRLDQMFRRKRELESLKLETDGVSFDALLTRDDRAKLTLLIGKITSFAFQKIKEESAHIPTSNKKAVCNCEVRVNYNLPCRHTIPRQGAIALSMIAKRWHLVPDNIEDCSSPSFINVGLSKNDRVHAQSRQLLHVLDAKIAAANGQQALTLLATLKHLSQTAYEPVESLRMPYVESRRGRPSSTKRLPLAVERASQEYRKDKKRKLVASTQGDNASRKLQFTKLNSEATALVNLATQARLRLEDIINDTVAEDTPSYIPHKSTSKIFNPLADGNCGFRALAEEVYGCQAEWKRVKDDLLDLYLQEHATYQNLYGFDDAEMVEILKNRDQPCAPRHWFMFPDCCQLAADRYQRALCFYSEEVQYLFLPTKGNCPALRPAIGLWLHSSHIRLLKFTSTMDEWPMLYPSHRAVCKELKRFDWSVVYPRSRNKQ